MARFRSRTRTSNESRGWWTLSTPRRWTPSLRAPNGVLEDTFMQATGRRIWNASSIYVPVLVIAGEFDTWSFPEDREGLMRDLTNAPSKRSVLINEATHFVLFEKKRFEFFQAIEAFLKEMHSKPP